VKVPPLSNNERREKQSRGRRGSPKRSDPSGKVIGENNV